MALPESHSLYRPQLIGAEKYLLQDISSRNSSPKRRFHTQEVCDMEASDEYSLFQELKDTIPAELRISK